MSLMAVASSSTWLPRKGFAKESSRDARQRALDNMSYRVNILGSLLGGKNIRVEFLESSERGKLIFDATGNDVENCVYLSSLVLLDPNELPAYLCPSKDNPVDQRMCQRLANFVNRKFFQDSRFPRKAITEAEAEQIRLYYKVIENPENFEAVQDFSLCHEIGHTIARDASAIERSKNRNKWLFKIAALIGFIGFLFIIGYAAWWAFALLALYIIICFGIRRCIQKYDRSCSYEREFAADRSVGLNPRLINGGIHFLEKFQEIFGDAEYDTHPSPSKRIERLRTLLLSCSSYQTAM